MSEISSVVVGLPVNPPVIFDKYELWLQFDTGECEVEIMFFDQLLKRLNEWNAVLPLTGTEQAEAVKYDFSWPCYDNCHVPVPIVELKVYYYDVYGVKHHTRLVN